MSGELQEEISKIVSCLIQAYCMVALALLLCLGHSLTICFFKLDSVLCGILR